MKSRVQFKFPTPKAWGSNSPPPEDKGVKCPGYARGGGGACWSFDLTGTLRKYFTTVWKFRIFQRTCFLKIFIRQSDQEPLTQPPFSSDRWNWWYFRFFFGFVLVCVIFVIKGVPGAPGLFSVLPTLSGVSVKQGTGPEHFRNTLRTSRNTPEQPPDGPDPPPPPPPWNTLNYKN